MVAGSTVPEARQVYVIQVGPVQFSQSRYTTNLIGIWTSLKFKMATTDIKSLIAMEDKILQRKLRRRVMCRINQRRSRDRLRKKAGVQTEEVKIWKRRIDSLQSYKNLIQHGQLLKQTRFVELRGAILQVFAQFFEHGVSALPNQLSDCQNAFLRFNLAEKCLINDLIGPQVIMEQFYKYSIIHDDFHMVFQSIQCLDPASTTYQLNVQLQMTITRATIAAIYPHMLFDGKFLSKAVGQKIQYPLAIRATFDTSSNKIVRINFEHNLVIGWCNLLGDFQIVAQVLEQSNIDSNTACITIGSDSLTQILHDYN